MEMNSSFGREGRPVKGKIVYSRDPLTPALAGKGETYVLAGELQRPSTLPGGNLFRSDTIFVNVDPLIEHAAGSIEPALPVAPRRKSASKKSAQKQRRRRPSL